MRHSILLYDKYNSIANYMLSDLLNLDNVEIEHIIKIKCESQYKLIYLCKKTLAKLLWAFRKRKWIEKATSKTSSIIITNEAMLGLAKKDILRLKKSGSVVIALLIDPLKANYPTIACIKDSLRCFDQIYTFDPSDATEFGLNYTNNLYSIITEQVKVEEKPSDIYYIGHMKDRGPLLQEMIKKGKERGVSFNIQIYGENTGEKKGDIVFLNKRKPYEEVLAQLQSTKCILDITQKGQTGITLRYYEAVVYNRKLLSNNDHIVNLPFYDSRYMKIFHGIEDIDWNWIKSADLPNYKYDGFFSPVFLIKRIENNIMFEQNKGNRNDLCNNT